MLDNSDKIQLLQDKKSFELASVQTSISGWNQTKFYLYVNVYYICFWKNKQRKKDIEMCDREIARLTKKWELFEERINKEIMELQPKIDYGTYDEKTGRVIYCKG